MKIALVHDWLIKLGGAERVLIALHKIFPQAPIYTLFYDSEFASKYLPQSKIIPSFLQKIPKIKKLHPWFKILMPSAIESLDLSGFDIVISSSHEFSHGIITKPKTRHICFYHSPSRILWDRSHEYIEDFKRRGRGRFKLFLIKLGQHFLRLWDRDSSQRPDVVIANSKHVARRIKKYYGREAKVIYPPIEKLFGHSHFGNARPHTKLANAWPPVHQNEPSLLVRLATKSNSSIRLGSRGSSMAEPERFSPYFLIVSQLYPHKNIGLAIEAFKKIPELNLLIAGEGPEYNNLKFKIENLKLGNVELLGFIPDEELSYYYQNCLGYIICNEEDFGISPVEAMSYGKPVLAYKKGGALETVSEGISGEFFEKLESEDLASKIKEFYKRIVSGKYNPLKIKKSSEKFSQKRFKKQILDILNEFATI